jgi:hypothetical protein
LALLVLLASCAAETPMTCVGSSGGPYRFECRGVLVDGDAAWHLCGEGRIRCADGAGVPVEPGVPGEMYCDHGAFRDGMTVLDGTTSQFVCDDSGKMSLR